jgi:hypothetical protein
VFFAVGFNLIVLTTDLILADYLVTFASLAPQEFFGLDQRGRSQLSFSPFFGLSTEFSLLIWLE